MNTYLRRWRIAGAVTAALAVGAVAPVSAQASTTKPRYGGEIKVGIFDTFPGFCLSNNPANSSLMAVRTMYETLFEKTIGGDYVGLLATGATHTADLKEWTIGLRPGVKFHDGVAFNADAVVANFQALTGQIAAGAYARAGLAGYGAKAYTVGTSTAFTANIKAVSKVDDLTVKFTLDRAQNDLPGTLYASGRFVMRSPSQLADSATCSTKPVGTGPFKFESSDPNTLVVVRNNEYWRKDPKTKAKLPYLDKITFMNVKEASQRGAAVRRGTIDAAMFAAGSEATFIKDLRLRKSVVTEYRSKSEYYPSLWMNQGKPGSPFASRNARMAVASCVNRKLFVEARARGEGSVATSIVGPTSAMYNTKGFTPFSVKKAKGYVAAYTAETGKPLEFSMPVDSSTSAQSNAKFLQKQWEKCGIRMTMVVEEGAVIIGKAFNATPKAGSYYNAYDLISILLLEGTDVSFNLPFLVTNSYPASSTNAVAPLFRNSVGTILGLNHHNDSRVDDLFYAGQAATTKAKAQVSYKAATKYLQENAFMTSMMNTYYSMFVGKHIQGVGKLQLQSGKTQRVMTNWGIDWTGVWVK
jgi:peptide/nickel transport system substrate-binding protein